MTSGTRRRPLYLVCALSLVVPILPCAATRGEDEDKDKDKGETIGRNLPLERLVELNAAALFGGNAKVDGDRIELEYSADGQVRAGFVGREIIDAGHAQMTGAQRNFIIEEKKDGVEKLIPGLAAVGIGQDMWVSKFPLAGDARIEFGFRIPNLITQQSTFRVRLNWDPEKNSGYETSFFQSIGYVSRNRTKSSQLTPIKEYQRAASYWFPRKKSSVKIEYWIKDGECAVRMNGQDMVKVDGIKDLGGHVAIAYRKIAFTIDNLKISGKLDREWCEKELERLEKKGELKTAPESAQTPAGE